MRSFIELLEETGIEAIPLAKEIIIIDSSETPIQGFEKLIRNNILSAPVWDNQEHKFTGFLDVRDLVSFAVYAFHNRNLPGYRVAGPVYTTLVENVTVKYLSRRNPFIPVPVNSKLINVAEILSRGVHRVPVVDENGKIINIISQSALIAIFDKHLNNKLRLDSSAIIENIGIGTSPVISVSINTSTIATFELMDSTKRSALAVVDTEGFLVGNVSARDLKLFVASSSAYDIMQLSIMNFLKQLRDEAIEIRAPSISCKLGDSLGLLIAKLAATRVHRLYIVKSDSEYKPAKVVSLTDIISYIMKHRN
eukprot:TRINITY_DN306_c1_g1_i1.p1 TRINITY_DN306_c1_g1~~TRINITY_DN306_c1_g1_i1.p1  ORF type:complete len:308 (-),score=129.98 TRINITY_DN306_c1_g1_i1:189-1112(-)